MKKVLLLLFIFLFSVSQAISQEKPRPVFLTTDYMESFLLDSTQLMMYVDHQGSKGIHEISSADSFVKFVSPQSIFKKTNTGIKAIWVHYQLKNLSDKEIEISIGAEADSVLTYLLADKEGKAAKKFLSGNKISWRKKDGFKESDLIPVSINANQTIDVYQRLSNQQMISGQNIAIGIFSTDKIIQNQFIEKENEVIPISHYGNIFFAGFFLLAALFNLLLFKVTRDREYFLLAGFLFFLFVQMNPWFTTVLARDNQWLAKKISDASLLYIVFFFQFVRHFFNTKLRIKNGDRVLYFVNVILALSIISDLVMDAGGSTEFIRSIIFVAAIGVYFIAIIYLFKLPGKEKKLFAGAMLPFLICFVSLFVVAIIYICFSSTGNNALDHFFEWIGEWAYLVNNFAISWAVLFFAHVLFRRYESQKKEIALKELEKEQERNALIATQKIELESQVAMRTAELEESLEKLTRTQNQLIHAEKMAALGQLTSGIAHEIQNPLNFVTNFSEVNEELIEEIRNEWENGDKFLLKELISDINENTRKINFHSKRADAIVKGMLQHSHITNQVKELTDINPLCDEMVRISYQAARAKNKMLKVKIITDYDPRARQVLIFAKEMSGVLFNILNNAFYAIGEKLSAQTEEKEHDAYPFVFANGFEHEAALNYTSTTPAADSTTGCQHFGSRLQIIGLPSGYEPTIWINTQRNENLLEISIKDNGTGINENHINKIFQPFFTTKPTGSGTGLGLSLAYEIVTRGHGGELLAVSKPGQYSEFIIRLPL